MNIRCKHCGTTAEAQRSTRKYCSALCAERARKGVQNPRQPQSKFTCEQCQCQFFTKPSRIARFCSNKCYHQFAAGANHPGYKGGFISQGYRIISVNGKRTFEHRYVMEQHLGRELLPSEFIHHKNGNRLDNRAENLAVMDSHRDHKLEHCTTYRDATHKECSKCRVIFPRTDFYRQKEKPNWDPHAAWCKYCCRKSALERLHRRS